MASPALAQRAFEERDRIVEIGVFGDARHAPRRVVAWVPAEHDRDPTRRFPVLYVHDGQAAFPLLAVHTAVRSLADEGAIEPWIVVAVDTTEDRRRELAEDVPSYADFLAGVVHPAVRASLRVREGRESVGTLGYSYGGLAAVGIALHRPELFGRVVAMSPSLWFRGRAVIERWRRHRGALPARMWLDIGSREGRRGELVPYMVRDARVLRDLAVARGMTFGRELGYDEAIGEQHDMLAARRRMRTALSFALSDVDLSSARPDALELTRYPAAASSPRTTFVVRARYAADRVLAWPPAAAHAREDRRDVVRALARRSAELVAEVNGASVTSRPTDDGGSTPLRTTPASSGTPTTSRAGAR